MRSVRLIVLALGSLASVATTTVESGERANDDDICILDCNDEGPVCPVGEDCSDDTPNGLYFGGMRTGDTFWIGDNFPKATVVGGRQRIRIYLDPDGEQPLDLPFDAELTTAAMSIAGQSGASVTVRGEASGSSRLRILEQGTDLLYDRIQLEAGEVAELRLIPSGVAKLQDVDLLDDGIEYAVVVGRPARFTAAMYASNGARLVDEDTRFDTTSEVRTDPQGFADTAEITAAGAGGVILGVHAGNFDGSAGVVAVTSPDEIISRSGSAPLQVPLGGSRQYCFAARAGGAYVLGAEWAYAGAGVTVAADDEYDYISDCVFITGDEVGPATITVTASGRIASFLVDVVDGTRARAAAPGDSVVPPDATQCPGERAD